ncbi:hypothetical protein VKT23_004931 [Stygiomarasmius scandens]|uniref:Uncharacterized protein n=1 Tax=Marasmiellus scandens TaxID=2682957 RepID=A0ABR1JRN5_9AGAR
MSSNNDLEKGSTQQFDRPPIQLSSEQYEKLFLQPGGRAPTGTLSYRFGNPTPLPILGYLLVLTPTACYLMDWGGADATSLVAICGPFYFLGGLCMVIGGVMEWILGNTFPFVVFTSFGGFWYVVPHPPLPNVLKHLHPRLSLGVINDPMHAVASAYSGGAAAVAYNKGLMFYFVFWAVTVTIFFVGSLRTNVVFALIFFTLIPTFIFLAAGYGRLGLGDADYARTLLKAAGAFAFANVCFAWYLITSLIMRTVEMPFTLPVGDLSHFLAKRS